MRRVRTSVQIGGHLAELRSLIETYAEHEMRGEADQAAATRGRLHHRVDAMLDFVGEQMRRRWWRVVDAAGAWDTRP